MAVTLGGICPQNFLYIKGIHNTVADAILQLEYDPKLNKTNDYTHAVLGEEPVDLNAQQWESFAHHWRTVHLTLVDNPVPGNQEFCLAPSETIVELVKKIRNFTWGIV